MWLSDLHHSVDSIPGAPWLGLWRSVSLRLFNGSKRFAGKSRFIGKVIPSKSSEKTAMENPINRR